MNLRFKNTSSEKGASAHGATLIEIIVAAGMLFVLLSFMLYFSVFTLKYTRALNARADIQTDLRRVQEELSKAIGAASWGKFTNSNIRGIYIFNSGVTSGYRHCLLLQSAVRDDGLLDIDSAGNLRLIKYILIYIIRPDGDVCYSVSGAPNNPDNACYHKLLVIKELDPAVIPSGISDPIDVWNTVSSYVSADLSTAGGVRKVKLISRQILSFDLTEPAAAPSGIFKIYVNGSEINVNRPYINIVLRCFKEKEFRSKLSSSDLEDLTKNNIWTFQLDTFVKPEN